MRHAPRILLPLLVLSILAGFVFARLIANPSGVLVDPDRPSVDRAVMADSRSIGNDATRFFLPLHLRIASWVNRTGRIPGWDPFGFGGRPLIGNPQAGLWYPPTWLVWRFWSLSAPGWATVLHLVWGGLGIFVLLQSQGAGRLASLVGACAWLGSPYLLAQTFEGHYPHVWAASWIPWTFWAVRENRWFVPPFLALGFLTGHPQETYYLALTLGAWFGWNLCNHPRRAGHWKAERTAACSLAGAGIAGAVLGITAIEWLPDVFVQPFTMRAASLSMRDAGKYHVNNLNLIQLLSPRALGGPSDYFGSGSYWEPLLSFGWVPLVLMAVAVAGSPRRKLVRGWLVLVIGSILFAWGPRLGLFRLVFATVPGMERFRVPARALFLAATGAAVLVGLGIEALALRIKPGNRFFGGYRSLVAGLILALGWAILHDSGTRLETDRATWIHAAAKVGRDPIFLVALCGTTFGLEWLRRRPEHGPRIALALGLLAVGELALYGHDLIRVSPPSRFVGPDEVSRAITSLRPEMPFRIRARDAFFDDLRAVSLGLEKTNANDSFQIQHAADVYETLYGMFGGLAPRRMKPGWDAADQLAVLDRMNVALLVSDRDDRRAEWPIGNSGTSFILRRNPDPLPRAYVVPRARVAADDDQLPSKFAKISPREAVFLPSDPLGNPEPRQPFTPAHYQSEDPDRVEIRVTTQSPGLLVVADTWMPGWSALVDGENAEILRGNRAHRVVPLRKIGYHHIAMRYEPPGWALGRAISSGTLAVWAVAAISWRVRWGIRRGRTGAGNR